MKSFQACLLVLATATNALVLPEIAKRDECTPGLYQCQADGQHWQQCTAGKVWSATMIVAPGTSCNPGISENPWIPAAGGSAPAPSSAPAQPPVAPTTTTAAAQPTTTAAAQPTTDSPPPPPASSTSEAVLTSATNINYGGHGGHGGHSGGPGGGAPGSTPPVVAPPAPSDTTSFVTTSQTSSTTTLATITATAASSVSDSPPPPPASSSSSTPATTVSDSPPPPPSSTDNPNAGSGPTVDQVCMEFTSDNPDWTYAMQNPWGSATGTFGSLQDGKLCVPTNNGAGGAMYIGSTPNPGPGNTKLECYFPTTGTANCDNSLVDGYSLSVKCTAGDAVIGSDLDLWKQDGITCKDPAPGGICLNKLAYLQAESDVDSFFQEAGKEKNCIWWACDQDYFFPVTETVKCHVSGTVPSN